VPVVLVKLYMYVTFCNLGYRNTGLYAIFIKKSLTIRVVFMALFKFLSNVIPVYTRILHKNRLQFEFCKGHSMNLWVP